MKTKKTIRNMADVPLGPALNTPGEILFADFLEPMGISLRELARRMGTTAMRISEIVRGRRSITAETAILLGQALETTPEFWMNLQTQHDLAKAAIRLKERKLAIAA